MEINTIRIKKSGSSSSIISHLRWCYPANPVLYTQCRRNQDHLSPITWKISTVFLFLHQKITIFEHWKKFPVSLPFLELPSNAFIAGDEDFTQVIPVGLLISSAAPQMTCAANKKGCGANCLVPQPFIFYSHFVSSLSHCLSTYSCASSIIQSLPFLNM